jgi:hypothetical protein
MSLTVLIPEPDAKPIATKDAVISILTAEWPLTLRAIFFKIKKTYGYSASYQAVYKAVKELVSAGVLVSADKKYELDMKWIKKLQSFTDIVETNYYAKERMNNISGVSESKKNGDILVLNFDTIFDAEKYLYYFMKTVLFKTKNDIVCHQFNSEWRPLFYLRAEYNYYKRLSQLGHKFYFICSGTSYIESLCKDFYKSIGVNYKNSKQKFPNDILVFDSYCIHIFIPQKEKDIMRDAIKHKDVIGLLEKALSAKSSIRVVITKDKDLASEIKKSCLSA